MSVNSVCTEIVGRVGAAVAVAVIVRVRVFVLYVALAMLGACASGFVAQWVIAAG